MSKPWIIQRVRGAVHSTLASLGFVWVGDKLIYEWRLPHDDLDGGLLTVALWAYGSSANSVRAWAGQGEPCKAKGKMIVGSVESIHDQVLQQVNDAIQEERKRFQRLHYRAEKLCSQTSEWKRG